MITGTAAHQPSLSFTTCRSLRRLTSMVLMLPSIHLVLHHHLLLLSSVIPRIGVFSSESALHIRWPIIGTSASASVLSMNIQDSFPLGLTGLVSLLSKGLSRVFSNITVQKHQFFNAAAFFVAQLSHPYMTTGKALAWTIQTFVGKVISLLFNMLPRFVITFLPRSKSLFNFVTAIIIYSDFGAQENKICYWI